MHLISRQPVGAGAHRSGWPVIVDALEQRADGDGLLLDDFTDATFSYLHPPRLHREPWVGIFHHPVSIDSPLPRDRELELRRLDSRVAPHWRLSKPQLRGAIGLCSEVTRELQDWLEVPTLTIKHPTETDVLRWNPEAALRLQQLLQVGYCMRNTQLIFQISPPGWQRGQLFGGNHFYQERDAALRQLKLRPDIARTKVLQLRWLSHQDYDELLAQSVVITELFGTAANNVTVECMVRGVPLVINRLPAVVEYLGENYPLFYDHVAEIPSLLSHERLLQAHFYLLQMAITLPTVADFAASVTRFVDDLKE